MSPEPQRLFARGSGVGVVDTAASRFTFASSVLIEATWPARRTLARVTVIDVSGWAAGDDDTTFEASGVQALVREDAVVVLRARRDLVVEIEGAFSAAYRGHRRGNWLLRDPEGGLGLHPLRARRARKTRFRDDGFELAYALRAGEELWIAAYPTRLPDATRERQRIAHEGRPHPFPGAAYPADELIAAAGQHCDVFALHAYFWNAVPPERRPKLGRYAGRRCSWLTPQHEPELPSEFERVTRTVAASGMDLVVYLSPLHSQAPDVRAEVRRVLETYPVQGLYLDGVARDLVELHSLVRDIRGLLGPDRILYLNASNEPFRSVRAFCPFIDAYADFVLRGDAGRGGLALDRFLQYAVSGRGGSNAVGLWCHYTSSGRVVPLERVPTTAHIEAAGRHGARLWRRSIWERGGGELERFERDIARVSGES